MLDSNFIVEFNKTILGSSHPKKDLLNSALSSFQYYDSIEEQIASIFRGIIKNHPFLDANKRTAIVCLFYLCEENYLSIPNDTKLFKIVITVAENQLSVQDITKLIFG